MLTIAQIRSEPVRTCLGRGEPAFHIRRRGGRGDWSGSHQFCSWFGAFFFLFLFQNGERLLFSSLSAHLFFRCISGTCVEPGAFALELVGWRGVFGIFTGEFVCKALCSFVSTLMVHVTAHARDEEGGEIFLRIARNLFSVLQ